MLPASFEELGKTEGISGLELYWIAFWELRSSTHHDSPIPWSEREAWGRAHRLDYDTRERLHELLSTMDASFRKWMNEKKETAEKKASLTQKGKGRRRGKRA